MYTTLYTKTDQGGRISPAGRFNTEERAEGHPELRGVDEAGAVRVEAVEDLTKHGGRVSDQNNPEKRLECLQQCQRR